MRMYFRIALLMPLVIPLAGMFPLQWMGQGHLAALLIYQLTYGGIGYGVFLLCVLAWSTRQPASRLRKAAWLLPPLFIPFCLLSFHGTAWLLGVKTDNLNWADFIGFIPHISLFCLVFGYAYVGLMAGVGLLLQVGRNTPVA
jgi:hypothetical protein